VGVLYRSAGRLWAEGRGFLSMSSLRVSGSFSTWDYVVFAAVLLISALVGIYHAVVGRGKETSEDFLLGSRQMRSIPVALSLTASFMSAVTMLGVPYDTYHFGAVNAYFVISYTLVVILSAEVFLPIFYRLGVTSSYEVRAQVRGRVTPDC